MSFGWSAGDIMAGIGLVKEMIKSLDDTRGSSKKYQQTSSFLKDLAIALDRIKSATDSTFTGQAKQETSEIIDKMKEPVGELLGMINKYHDALGTDTKQSRYQTFGRKLQWRFVESEEMEKSQAAIERKVEILKLYLQIGEMEKQKIFHAMTQTMLEDLQRTNAQKSDLQALSLSLANIEQRMASASIGTQPALENQNRNTESLTKSDTKTDIKLYLQAMDNSRYFKSLPNPELLTQDWRPDLRLYQGLDTWWKYDVNTFLWIKELKGLKISRSANGVRSAAFRQRLPMVYSNFSAHLNDQQVEPKMSQSLVDMLYSMIYQLTKNLYQAKSTADWNLTVARFEQLDGTPDSISDALSLIQDLINLSHSKQMMILVGFEVLDDKDDSVLRKHLSALLEILRAPEGSGPGVLKTLVFSSGSGPSLLEETLRRDEKLNLSTRSQRGSFDPIVFTVSRD
ncbi:hypothetical protein PVAG01_00851 [Phlyctema vagabunda]|uniref:Fungal N-terminal domain-containing protein n=1 Tax=Phlyctema vagabunda TaxID=108571 RepID=A0ABR4PW08_9HELO